MNVFITFQTTIQLSKRMKRKYPKAFKEEVLAWRLATGSTLKETSTHFDVPPSTIGTWNSKIQVNIGQVEPAEMVEPVLVDEQPQGGDQVTHDTTDLLIIVNLLI